MQKSTRRIASLEKSGNCNVGTAKRKKLAGPFCCKSCVSLQLAVFLAADRHQVYAWHSHQEQCLGRFSHTGCSKRQPESTREGNRQAHAAQVR